MGQKKWYAVRKGYKTGIYKSWFGEDGAKKQVDGYKGAQYKGFTNINDAENFMSGKSGLSVSHKNSENSHHINENMIIVYTDGGCINNPGAGGYGAVIIKNGIVHKLSGGRRYTTNNRMEMLACIKALEYLKLEKREIVVYTDSAYIVNAVNKKWLFSWQKNNFIKSDGKEVLNRDLWIEILKYLNLLNVKLRWVKGHSGIEYNEICDKLANSEARKNSSERDKWFESLSGYKS
ncbi:MAG: ribonuclease HI [Deltaproteobacteria bacterium]|nr:MAG: ribonuclease HI [Deltaproteobacteria bacterium]